MAEAGNKGDRASRFVTNHLANERTFLAYLRTAVSLMSFGIAINRFSFFLERDDIKMNRQRFTLMSESPSRNILEADSDI